MLWNMKALVIPIIVCALGKEMGKIVNLRKNQDHLDLSTVKKTKKT